MTPASPLDDEIVALAVQSGRALLAAGLKVVTAESCTGGGVAAALTDVAGSSQWFERGYVTYSNAAKIQDLGIERALIERHGAVSAEVAAQMSAGALRASGAHIAVAVTGIAGPEGGTAGKPVGQVFFAVLRRNGAVHVLREQFPGDRSSVRRAAVAVALRLIMQAAAAANFDTNR
ncbi:MAG: CinA family protein [Steroidobacteraceae bacterium]